MRKYETSVKIDGRYYFLGWYPMEDEKFCIDTRTRTIKDKDYTDGKWIDTTKTLIYKTYKYLNDEIKTYKYGSYVDEEENIFTLTEEDINEYYSLY